MGKPETISVECPKCGQGLDVVVTEKEPEVSEAERRIAALEETVKTLTKELSDEREAAKGGNGPKPGREVDPDEL